MSNPPIDTRYSASLAPRHWSLLSPDRIHILTATSVSKPPPHTVVRPPSPWPGPDTSLGPESLVALPVADPRFLLPQPLVKWQGGNGSQSFLPLWQFTRSCLTTPRSSCRTQGCCRSGRHGLWVHSYSTWITLVLRTYALCGSSFEAYPFSTRAPLQGTR